MAFSDRSYNRNYSSSPSIPLGVRWLLIITVGIWIIDRISAEGRLGPVFQFNFALVPASVVGTFAFWQLGTYMFVHSLSNVTHILFNMLTLWWFGQSIEIAWGTRRFVSFYLICGVGAGVCVVVINLLFGNPTIPTIGASGAIYGVMLAFAVLYPDATILAFFVFPMKAKHFVGLMIALEFFLGFYSGNSQVSNTAHLGGLLTAFLYLRTQKAFRGDPLFALSDRYRAWKIERNKKKFQVYMRKHSDRDPWVN